MTDIEYLNLSDKDVDGAGIRREALPDLGAGPEDDFLLPRRSERQEGDKLDQLMAMVKRLEPQV